MKNLGQLMKQAQAMQEKMAEMQAQLEAVEMTGVAGGGMVQLTLNGKGDVKRVKIDKAVADPSELDTLIQLLAKLPGLGPRSARRAALFMLKRREQVMEPLAAALGAAAAAIRP